MLRSYHPAKFAKIWIFLLCTFKFKFSQILLGDKNATSFCSKNISTLFKKLYITFLLTLMKYSTSKSLRYRYENIRMHLQKEFWSIVVPLSSPIKGFFFQKCISIDNFRLLYIFFFCNTSHSLGVLRKQNLETCLSKWIRFWYWFIS